MKMSYYYFFVFLFKTLLNTSPNLFCLEELLSTLSTQILLNGVIGEGTGASGVIGFISTEPVCARKLGVQHNVIHFDT